AVKKICHDEYEIHVEMDKAVLRNEHLTERGRAARQQTLPLVRQMIRNALDLECTWVDYMGMDEDPLSGLNGKNLKSWVMHSGGDVYNFLELKPDKDLVIPKSNPLGYMTNYMNLSKSQPSPQEQLSAIYKVNVMTRNDQSKIYEIDF
ncbi:MAG TPA: hypothetical protein VN843_06125, partial [Anaerolineales bacterium]|nr:hypothetical protein [Anaerolineales bacterium]